MSRSSMSRSEEHTSELQSLRHLVCRSRAPLFPYTTLFRSQGGCLRAPAGQPGGDPAQRRPERARQCRDHRCRDRKSTRLNSSHLGISYAGLELLSFPTRRSSDLRVVAFEPLPANLEAIRRNVALNGLGNVEIIDVALSDTEGTAELQLHSQKPWAKLDTSSDTGFQQGLQATAHLEVQVSTIDRQLQRLPAPDLVKIDIEGAEVAALRGATVLLTEHRPTIICEFHGTNEAVSELLESHGYTLQTVETPDVHPREARWDAHVLATPSAVS